MTAVDIETERGDVFDDLERYLAIRSQELWYSERTPPYECPADAYHQGRRDAYEELLRWVQMRLEHE